MRKVAMLWNQQEFTEKSLNVAEKDIFVCSFDYLIYTGQYDMKQSPCSFTRSEIDGFALSENDKADKKKLPRRRGLLVILAFSKLTKGSNWISPAQHPICFIILRLKKEQKGAISYGLSIDLYVVISVFVSCYFNFCFQRSNAWHGR